MPTASVTLPTLLPQNRVITFNDTCLTSNGRVIAYDEITNIRLFVIDQSFNGKCSLQWTVEVASRKARISANFQNSHAPVVAPEAFDRLCVLTNYFVIPHVANRIVALLQKPGSEVQFGPFTLSQQGITDWHWSHKNSLPWAEYGGVSTDEGKIFLHRKPFPQIWWTGSIKMKMGFLFAEVLDAAHRSLILGDNRPVMAEGEPPQDVRNSPELVAALGALKNRPAYVHDGGLDPIAFFGILLVLLPLAVSGAALLSALFFWGLYLYVFVPFVLTIPLVIAMAFLLRWARCRNWIAGGVLGLTLGLVMYIGQYYCSMVYTDPRAWSHPEQLLDYFQYELSNTQIFENTRALGSTNPTITILLSIVELVGVLIMSTFVGSSQCCQAYGDQGWLKKEIVHSSSGDTPLFVLAFARLDPTPIAGLKFAKGVSKSPQTRLIVEYTPQFTGAEPDEIFLTVGESFNGGWEAFPKGQPGGIFRVRFSRQEIEKVVGVFGFKSL